MSKWIAYAVLVAAFFLVVVAPTRGAELTPQQARDILVDAYRQYHGSPTLLDNPPQLHIASQDELQKRACATTKCRPIHALYDEEDGEIYLFAGLDFSTVYATTALLHEYIHHFQVRTRGRVMDMKLSQSDICLEILEREHEAYRIQWEVLLKAGEYMLAQKVRQTASQFGCRKQESQSSTMHMAVSMGKAFRCEEEARFAMQLLRDADYTIPTINLLADRDKKVLAWLRVCSNEQQPIRECVIAKCTATGME